MKVVSQLDRKLPVKLERIIEKLLYKIPDDHLKGIDRVIITDEITKDDKAGIYYSGKHYNFKYTEIEINLSRVFWPNAYFIFFLPVIPKFIIADTLYHEIGHNYQRMVPGVKKEKEEDFAEAYKNTYIDRAFPIFGIIRTVFFSPLYKIIAYFFNNNQNHRR